MKKTKFCNRCGLEKPETHFSPNRHCLSGVTRRAYCMDCESKKIPVNKSQLTLFEVTFPRPDYGELFSCPLCLLARPKRNPTDVCLDHSPLNGNVRGWLCNTCNTNNGKWSQDQMIRAIAYGILHEKKNSPWTAEGCNQLGNLNRLSSLLSDSINTAVTSYLNPTPA
jgi:hypothetical protein